MNKKQDENTEIINTTGPEAVEARTEAAAEKAPDVETPGFFRRMMNKVGL